MPKVVYTVNMSNKIKELLGPRCQMQFAKDLGVSRSIITHWITGRCKPSRWLMPTFLEHLSRGHDKQLTVNDVWQKNTE